MKSKTIIAIIFMMMSAASQAQVRTLQVNVLNSKQEVIEQATVTLLRLPDSSAIKRQTGKKKPVFNVLINTSYLLHVTSAGMQEFYRSFTVDDSTNAITVEMQPNIGNLQAVTIVAKRPLIKQDDDKTIVDAEVLANSSTNAYEVLEKTPGAILDQDGNVYLNSTIPATIFINGREMKLSSADIASLLKSLPAGSVSKIEILRTPSAKFDASSSGGIVNIVLKKGVKLGTSGSLNIAYFQGVYSTQTAGFTINKGSGKLNSYLNYQFTKRNNFESLNSDRFISRDSSVLTQKSYTTYPSLNNYVSAGGDYAFSKKFNAGYDFRFSNNDGNSYALNLIDISNRQTGLATGKNESDIDNNNHSVFIGNTVSTKYKIDSAGSEWTTQLEYNYYKNNNDQQYRNIPYMPAGKTIAGDGENRNRKNIYVIQSDLTLKLPKKYTMEAGVKATFSNSSNSAAYFKDTGNSVRFTDTYQTNTFRYKESIFAAYLQVSKTFFGFTLKPGIRLEHTDINGRQLIPSDTNFSIKRTDLFPYVYLKHNLFKMFGVQLVGNAIFRRSIKRPYYEILNPFPRYVDQYLFDVGNPSLKPQFTTNYELNASFNDIPVLSFGINETKDIFSNVTYQDNVTKIAFRTYDNLGKNREIYARLIGGIPPGGKYFFYIGGQYNYNRYRGTYQGSPLNYDRGSLTVFMFQELKATPTFTINMQGFMRTRGLQNLYELETFGGLFVSVNKALLNKKMNVIISINDLLRTNQVSFRLNQADINATGTRINDTRRLGVTIRYNFGIKPKEEKKTNFDAPAETN